MATRYRSSESVLQDVHAALEAYGCNPKPLNGTKFTSRCPAHDDTDPSLSISIGDTGILINCFAGCDTENILNAIGYDFADLFYETTEREEPVFQVATVTPIRADISHAKIDQALRDRLAAATDLLAQIEHERCIPRETLINANCGLTTDGRIVLPTFDREGELAPREWLALAEQRAPGKPKMKGPRGAKPDLWPRPETPRYKDNTSVTIVEGEPDALLAVSHNIQACGLPGTKTWQPEDAHRFARFSHVTVLLDDDEPGREASRIISRDLRKAGINVTEQHHTPGPPTLRDLTDLAREHADLNAAITQLPIIEPDTLHNRALSLVNLDHMLDTEPEPRAWIWDDYFTRGTLNMIHGAAGLGKSMIGLAVAAACTSTMPIELLGHLITPCGVSIIDAENSEDEIHRRLRRAGILDRTKLHYYRTSLTILDDSETRDLFTEIAKHSNVVILDSQRGLWSGDEREQGEAGRMLRDLARIAEELNICIIVIHHDTKAGQYSGTSDIDAAISGTRLHIERTIDPRKKTSSDDEDEKWKERRLTHAKCRIGQEQPPITFKITIDDRIWLQTITGPTSELENTTKRIYEWAKQHDKWPNIPVEDIKQFAGFDAGDEERNGWRPLGQHLRNGRWAKPYNGRNSRVIEFIQDAEIEAA